MPARTLLLFMIALASTAPQVARAQPAAGDTAATAADSTIVLPPPTGPHHVGVFATTWWDATRPGANADRSRGRQLEIECWYPADAASAAAPASYAPTARVAGDLAQLLARVRPHAAWRAPFAAAIARAPVLVLATGRSTATYDYTSLAEDLASHGYVVVGVNSPGLSRMQSPDGAPIPVDPAPTIAMLQHFAAADSFFEPMIRNVAVDLRFVVDGLSRLDRADSSLAHHLDLDRIGMLGHSNGALAASRACAAEPHCRACLGIEGTQARELRKSGVRKPYGLLISEQSLGFDSEGVYRELGAHSPSLYTIVHLRGAGHNSATDMVLSRPGAFHYGMSALDGIALGRAAVRAFFDEHLLERKGDGPAAVFAGDSRVDVQGSFVEKK